MTLSKLDMLVIRACKSKDPILRLRSVYKRFWFSQISDNLFYNCMIPRLVRYVAEYSNPTPMQLIEMSRQPWYIEGMGIPWEQTTFENLVTMIRHTKVSAFPEETIWPVCYRSNTNDHP